MDRLILHAVRKHRDDWVEVNGRNPGNARPADVELWELVGGIAGDGEDARDMSHDDLFLTLLDCADMSDTLRGRVLLALGRTVDDDG